MYQFPGLSRSLAARGAPRSKSPPQPSLSGQKCKCAKASAVRGSQASVYRKIHHAASSNGSRRVGIGCQVFTPPCNIGLRARSLKPTSAAVARARLDCSLPPGVYGTLCQGTLHRAPRASRRHRHCPLGRLAVSPVSLSPQSRQLASGARGLLASETTQPRTRGASARGPSSTTCCLRT